MEQVLHAMDGNRLIFPVDVQDALQAQQIGALGRGQHFDPVDETIPIQWLVMGQAKGADMIVMTIDVILGVIVVMIVMPVFVLVLMVMMTVIMVMLVMIVAIGFLAQPALHIHALGFGIIKAGIEKLRRLDTSLN
jgi:hypothetical protein